MKINGQIIKAKKKLWFYISFVFIMIAISHIGTEIQWRKTQEFSVLSKNEIFKIKVKLIQKAICTTSTLNAMPLILQNKQFYDPYRYKPMRLIETASGFRVYSVGPDHIDNNAEILYDPTNGLVSSGDLVHDIQRCKSPSVSN